jgi:hypothetical protein
MQRFPKVLFDPLKKKLEGMLRRNQFLQLPDTEITISGVINILEPV